MKMVEKIIYHLVRLCLAIVFIYAGFVKAGDIVLFARQVAAYQILPYTANYLVAATLPYVELLAGVLLLLNARIRPALLTLGSLLLVFMFALISILTRGLEIDCGCFNPKGSQEVSASVALLRDAVLMVLVILAWWLRSRSCHGARLSTLDRGPTQRL